MLGFNMNFAPVMSIMTDERDLLSNGLYSRSFGRSPGEVLGYTTVYLRGLQETGMVGCLKHFPGIGAGEVDSHEEMPMVSLSHDALIAQDLAPYIELFQRKDDRVRCVMVSHGGFPNIDIEKGMTGGLLEPASLSHNIVTNLLRRELGYQHLVVTDDLEMGAIAKHCEIESAVVRAFLAGEDMFLICARPDIIRRGYHAMLEAGARRQAAEGSHARNLETHRGNQRQSSNRRLILTWTNFSASRMKQPGSMRSSTTSTEINLMRSRKFAWLLGVMLVLALLPAGCRKRNTSFVIALGDNILTIDPIGSPSVDAASERVRTLMFNSLVRKNEKFDYVGELASNVQQSADGRVFTFTLHDGVKFHDGRALTSADAKYTLDLVFSSSFAKSASFYEGTGPNRRSYIQSVEAPDAKTIVVTLVKPWTGLLSNLVPVAIIPKDSYATQKDHPLGSGPFKFISYDSSQQVLDLQANTEYWEGAPQIPLLRVRVIADTNALQAELRSGRVDISPLPTSLSPDAVKLLKEDPNLQVLQFTGSNVYVLTLNCTQAPLNDVRVRQALGSRD